MNRIRGVPCDHRKWIVLIAIAHSLDVTYEFLVQKDLNPELIQWCCEPLLSDRHDYLIQLPVELMRILSCRRTLESPDFGVSVSVEEVHELLLMINSLNSKVLR